MTMSSSVAPGFFPLNEFYKYIERLAACCLQKGSITGSTRSLFASLNQYGGCDQFLWLCPQGGLVRETREWLRLALAPRSGASGALLLKNSCAA